MNNKLNDKIEKINCETDWTCEIKLIGISCEHNYYPKTKFFQNKDINKALKFCFEN